MIGSISMFKNQTQSGFTLVEALIATAVLSIVIVIVVGMSLQFFGTQRVTRDQLRLEGVARQTYSLIAERTREAIMDYTFYDDGAPLSDPSVFLAVRDDQRVQTVFWFYDDGSNVQLYICDDKEIDEECDYSADPTVSGGDWELAIPDDIELKVAKMHIQPTSPPYYDDSTPPASDQSPVVSVTMQLALIDSDTSTAVLQTSVTPRLYVR